MKKEFFGINTDGKAVTIYTLENDRATLRVMDRGATVTGFTVYGRDIIGGFDKLEDYFIDDSHQGGTIGRVANRIAGAQFTMDEKTYTLPKNDHDNCLHGGDGFDKKMWCVKEYSDECITFSYMSKDGEEGFPGEVLTEVTYILSGTDLIIDYTATPNSKTPINLTNHSYFNLNGFGGDIKNHKLTIYADKYTEVDDNLIPNGKRPSVKNTLYDFTKEHLIGERVGAGFEGYDHNYILCPTFKHIFIDKELSLAAEVSVSDMKMKVYTDQPCIQFYMGNFLGNGPDFKGGIKQVKHGAFCLETQEEPNCINHGISFYDKGDVYKQTTVYSIEIFQNDIDK